MAVLQINDPLGLTLLYNFGAPEAAFSFATGCGFLICTGILQWLAVALGGSLFTWPLAHLGTFVVLSIITSYLIYASPHLGRLWVWAQVPILTGFYLWCCSPEHSPLTMRRLSPAWRSPPACYGYAIACYGHARRR